MEKTNVKIGGGGQDRKTHYYLPFEFKTLKEFPFPIWTVLFTLIFFGLIWHWYEETVNKYINVTEIMPNLSNFVHLYHKMKKPLPEVLIAGGCSITGNTYRKDLEEKLGVPVGKVGQGGICFWEPERILKKYPEETKNVKVIVITLEHFMKGGVSYSKGHVLLMQRGNSFHFLKDLTDFSLQNIKLLYGMTTNETIRKKPIFLPPRFSLRSIMNSVKNADTDENYNSIERSTLNRKCTSQKKKDIEDAIKRYGNDPNIQTHLGSYSDDFDRDVRKLVEYCRSKKIFLIATIPPVWYKLHPYKPEVPTTESDHRFLALIAFLNQQPHCKVLYLKNFRDIIPDAEDSELLIDIMHTTAKGATVYTNWLADQMLNDQKIMAALKTPRKQDTYLAYLKKTFRPYVGKDIKKAYHSFAGVLKKQKTTKQKNVKIAQPTKNPVR
ncbi:MAG: hypothetical protein LBE12_15280 [Planctomycetaceae bacterium]|jgi:hypothetical protein|nr:hypothetical protein [Planctomycetaceae bacterium]